MRLPLYALLVISLLACSKKGETAGAGSLAGRWKLTEYYVSPGDFNVQWVKADPSTPSFVEFTLTGKMIFSGGNQPQRIYDYDTIAPGRIVAQKDNISVPWGYEFDNSRLMLSGGGCIEACMFRYKRVPSQNTPDY